MNVSFLIYLSIEIMRRDALWKYVEYSVDDLEKEMNAERFSEREQELTKQLLEFIEKSEFGVTVSKLIVSVVLL